MVIMADFLSRGEERRVLGIITRKVFHFCLEKLSARSKTSGVRHKVQVQRNVNRNNSLILIQLHFLLEKKLSCEISILKRVMGGGTEEWENEDALMYVVRPDVPVIHHQ